MLEQIILILVLSGVAAYVFINNRHNSYYKNLFELEEAFEGELDFSHLAKNILSRVLTTTSSTAGMIYWNDEAKNVFKLKTVNGIPGDQINQIILVLRQPKGILEVIQNHPEGFLLEDLQVGSKNFGNLGLLAKTYRSLMVIPFSVQKKLRGVLIIYKTNVSYTRRQLKLLTLFAPRAAVWLDNVWLYQLTRETALENAKLYVNICKLYQKATLDDLTGLYNRNFLMQRIKEEFKKAWRFKQPLSLIFGDLDFFKKVNDGYGHQVGDQLLMEFGDFLKKSVRDYDVACRFGGEEFIILLPQTSLDDAVDLAERLREKIAGLRFCSPIKNLKITASFGVSSISDFSKFPLQLDDENLTDQVEILVTMADNALYRAKEAGRNKVWACRSDDLCGAKKEIVPNI